MKYLLSATLTLMTMALSNSALAQEMLTNPSFENVSGFPHAPANGNNFYGNPPGWTVTPTGTTNIVLPWSGYTSQATTTPPGGGTYYLDLNSGGVVGTVQQTVTVATPGVFNISGWFSARDSPQNLSGCAINILNASNQVVATASVTFASTEPLNLWKQASLTNVALPAGTYTFQIVLPDPANVDLLSFYRLPPLSITKTSSIYSDPVNGVTSPKPIPGSVVNYCILLNNNNTYSASNVTITDPLPNTITYVPNTLSSGTSCATATANPAAGATISGSNITVVIPTLASGASYAVTFKATVN